MFLQISNFKFNSTFKNEDKQKVNTKQQNFITIELTKKSKFSNNERATN